jgi:hypothetical protein
VQSITWIGSTSPFGLFARIRESAVMISSLGGMLDSP